MLLAPMNPLAPPVPPLDHVHTSAALSLQAVGVFPPSRLHMPPTKRPKLSLQTSQFSTSYGSSASATGNRIDNLSSATPTTLNTFNNAFDLSLRPSPNSATTSPATFHPRRKQGSLSPFRRQRPYDLNLPLGVRPILKNSALPSKYRLSSRTASASPRTGRRVFFPPPKRVSFRTIDEEIVTHTYTARHVDLSSEEDDEELSSGSELVESESSEGEVEVEHDDVDSGRDHAVVSSASTAPHQPDAADEERERSRSPDVEGRGRRRRQRSTSGQRSRRKRRRWEWTLGNPEEDEEMESGAERSSALQQVVVQHSAQEELQPETQTQPDERAVQSQPNTEIIEVVDDTVALAPPPGPTADETPQPDETATLDPSTATATATASVNEQIALASPPLNDIQTHAQMHILASSTPLPPSPVLHCPHAEEVGRVQALVKRFESGA